MLYSKVPFFPNKNWVFGVVGAALLLGVQLQPPAAPRHARTSQHCRSASQRTAPAPDISQRTEEQITFGGIGAYMAADQGHDDRFTVVECIEGTPAHLAGLQGGDVIEQIDGRTQKGIPVEQSVAQIRGTEGTVVHLRIFRPSEKARYDVDLTRATIHAPRTRPASR